MLANTLQRVDEATMEQQAPEELQARIETYAADRDLDEVAMELARQQEEDLALAIHNIQAAEIHRDECRAELEEINAELAEVERQIAEYEARKLDLEQEEGERFDGMA